MECKITYGSLDKKRRAFIYEDTEKKSYIVRVFENCEHIEDTTLPILKARPMETWDKAIKHALKWVGEGNEEYLANLKTYQESLKND